VLLVEDDADHAELVRRGFAGQRTAVDLAVCSDAESALEHLRGAGRDGRSGGSVPQLILLDLRLPRMTGLQLLRELKSVPALSTVPCVVLTTSEAEADVTRAHELDVSGYLVKPADHERFAQLIAEVERYWSERSGSGQPTG
jgi:CheY-like chemotaxis protein